MRIAHSVRRRPIGLTPLIDVVFLLLVFFLLASSFAREEVITVRFADRGAAASAEAPVRVDLAEDGTLLVEGNEVAPDGLGAAVAGLAGAERAVVVSAAPEVPLDEIVAVLDRITAAGVEGVALAR